jgi:serine/threonine protein kinase
MDRTTMIVMPSLTPLKDCLSFPIRNAVAFGKQLLEGVEFMHTNGIVHRDLKPSNIVLDTSLVKLFIIDYGLAMTVGKGARVRGFTGTDGHTAPEVRDDSGSYGVMEADLWATGHVLQYILELSSSASWETEQMVGISRQLMDFEPMKRPTASAALARLESLGSRISLPLMTSGAYNVQSASEMEWEGPQHPSLLTAH